MKTLTFLTTLVLATIPLCGIAQTTNTNRTPLPQRTIRLENERTNTATPQAQLPLRTAATNQPAIAETDRRATNVAAAATNLAAAATNLAAAATNLATATTNPASRAAPLRAAITNAAPGASRTAPLPAVPTLPVPGRTVATTSTASTTAAPGVGTTPSPTTPITAVSTNIAADDVIIPPGLIKFQDADLLQVLEFYQDLTGRTVIRPATLPQTKISVRTQTPLTRREAVQLLDSILAMNQITMVPQGEKFVKAVGEAQAQTQAREFNELLHADLPNSGSIVAQVVQLSNAVPRDVAQALQPFAKLPNSILGIDSAGILILRDYAENVKRMMEVLQKIDVVPIQEFEPVIIPIKYALAADIAQALGQLTAGGGGGTSIGRQTTRTGLSSGGGGFGQTGTTSALGGSGGVQPGQPGYNPQQQGGIASGSLSGSAAGRSSFANRLQQIVRNAASAGDIVVLGNTKIIADERTNALLIFASKGDFVMISNIIEKLDVVLAQVLIEGLVLEVSLNDSEEYGISYLQRKKKLGGGGLGAGALVNQTPQGDVDSVSGLGTNLFGGFSYFMRWGDFDIALKAAADDGRVSILSRPRIQTSHAVEANLFVGETRPYPTSSQFGGVYGNYASIQQLQIGITLSVLPLINPDGLVVMDIRQKIQDVGDPVSIQGVGEVPSTIDREAAAKVAVKDGDTIVLGGLISSDRRSSKQGVPFLKDIPVLGWLFRSSNQSANRRELMVFIRPTVLPTPSAAAIAATAEKEKLPGISQAEWEVTESERKRLEEYQRIKIRREEEALREIEKTQRETEKLRRELYKKEGFVE
jgi:general secretion pathway protein D